MNDITTPSQRAKNPAQAPRIAWICVNYRSEDETKALVRNLDSLQGADDIHLLVVNNSARGADDDAFSDLLPEHLRLSVINAPENPGYFGGAAKAWRDLEANGASGLDWVILSNTDIQIEDPGFLKKLLDQSRPEPATVVAPRIVSRLSLRDQNPYMTARPSRARMHAYKWLFSMPGLNLGYQVLSAGKSWLQNRLSDSQPNVPVDPRPIYAPHGSFLIFHRKYFERGGSFTHGVFLFGEEITVAETVRRLGFEVWFDPSLVVFHCEHATTGRIPSARIRRYIAEASRFCADRYF